MSAASSDPSASSSASANASAASKVNAEASSDEARMSFLEHLVELRQRILTAAKIYVVVLGFTVWKSEWIIGLIARPLEKAWRATLDDTPLLHADIAEPFTVAMRVALYGAIVVSSPAIFWQLWGFIAPGLYKRERRMSIAFVTFATLLFAVGVCFAYFVALPSAFRYLLPLHAHIPGTHMRIAPLQRLGDYFDFILQSLLIFGVSFELPLVLLFLGVVGLVDHVQLWKFGRFFILIAFTVGAIFSPPDVVSQILISVPLCALYFLSIALVYLFGTKVPVTGKPGPAARRRALPS